MWPVLFIIGLAFAGLKIGEKLRPRDIGVGAALPRLSPPPRRVSHVALLNAVLERGDRPSRFLVTAAMREAYDRGDWATVSLIADAFHATDDAPPPEAPADAPDPDAPQTAESPLASVSSDDWGAFCQALASKPADHRSDRHHGRYEHNLGRLRQLGITPPETEGEQDRALALDMNDYWTSQAKLIADYSGDVVDVEGQPHAITASGVLGLLKAAGPQGAASWLSSEADRKKFPHTTSTFLRTNGCF